MTRSRSIASGSGLPSRVLADSSGLTRIHLAHLEQGKSRSQSITVETLAALARALGISPLLLAAAAFEDLAGDA